MSAALVDEYCSQLRQRQIEGSMPCAKRTAEILRLIVTQQKHQDAAALIDDIRSVGYKIQAARPVELSIGNTVRRILHIVREEQQQENLNKEPAESTVKPQGAPKPGQVSGASLLSAALRQNRAVSLSNLLDVGITDMDQLIAAAAAATPAQLAAAAGAAEAADAGADAKSQTSTKPEAKGTKKGVAQWKNKQHVIEAINELIDELDNIQGSITVQGVEHIHANEVILTFGMSDTTLQFLREANKKREFQVVVAEGAPKYDGHNMARKLADGGVQTTLIADSAVFAMMARANKVLVGAHAVLANGGVIAPVGVHMVALAAKRHSIPFVVLVGLHKLSPLFPHDPDLAFNDFKSPSDVADFGVLAEAFAAQLEQDASRQHQDSAATSSTSAPASGTAGSVGGSSSTVSNSPFSNAQPQQPGTASGAFESSAGSVVHVPNPAFDYIPPELVSLLVTDTGGYTPSYVYRLLTEYYSREDYLLSKQLINA